MSPPGRQRITAMTVAPGPGHGCLMAVLLLSALVTGLQRRRSRGFPAAVSGIWELAAIVLAPPLFAFTVPAAAAAIAGRPARRLACALGPAAAGLTDGAVSAAFHAAAPPLRDGTQGGTWLLAVAAAGVLRQVLACAVGRLAWRGEPTSAAGGRLGAGPRRARRAVHRGPGHLRGGPEPAVRPARRPPGHAAAAVPAARPAGPRCPHRPQDRAAERRCLAGRGRR